MTERRFDEEEVALILRNAINPTRRGPVESSEGLTLAEVKEIASEVGIDPRTIEAAANALDIRSSSVTHPLLGAPVTYPRDPPGRVPPGALVVALKGSRRGPSADRDPARGDPGTGCET